MQRWFLGCRYDADLKCHRLLDPFCFYYCGDLNKLLVELSSVAEEKFGIGGKMPFLMGSKTAAFEFCPVKNSNFQKNLWLIADALSAALRGHCRSVYGVSPASNIIQLHTSSSFKHRQLRTSSGFITEILPCPCGPNIASSIPHRFFCWRLCACRARRSRKKRNRKRNRPRLLRLPRMTQPTLPRSWPIRSPT